MSMVDPRTPVLVGVGVASRREQNPARALEPSDLMLEAVQRAGEDCGIPTLLAEVDTIAVPRGRWHYRNPAGEIAREIGASRATSIVSSVGVLQQSLIAKACADIADGSIETALVTGADAGYRLLRAKLTGDDAAERDQGDDPDVRLEPAAELRHPAELAVGLTMPVGLYAMLESARRAASGLSVGAHRDRMATRSARFAEIAAANPHAWNRQQPGIAEVRDVGPRNPMQAFPYTRAQCSTWNVDQAAALLLCSAGRAEALGIDRANWVFPVASAESNHMVPLSARYDLTRSPGADATAAAVLAESGVTIDQVDLIDLYSCFPVAVDMAADAAGLGTDIDLTITGGMAFAGGPYNNYFFQATARAAELLRAGVGRTALLSCVSGILTKQAFALWSADPPPRGFVRRDVTEEVANMASAQPMPVVQNYSGEAVVAGCTVVHARGAAPIAVALLDTPGGKRTLAVSDAANVLAGMEQDEWVGRQVRVVEGRLLA